MLLGVKQTQILESYRNDGSRTGLCNVLSNNRQTPNMLPQYFMRC